VRPDAEKASFPWVLCAALPIAALAGSMSRGVPRSASGAARNKIRRAPCLQMMATGRVQYFDKLKGYGFIRLDDDPNLRNLDEDPEDVYIHEIEISDSQLLQLGDAISFDIEYEKVFGDLEGKKIIKNIKGGTGGPLDFELDEPHRWNDFGNWKDKPADRYKRITECTRFCWAKSEFMTWKKKCEFLNNPEDFRKSVVEADGYGFGVPKYHPGFHPNYDIPDDFSTTQAYEWQLQLKMKARNIIKAEYNEKRQKLLERQKRINDKRLAASKKREEKQKSREEAAEREQVVIDVEA
jgi:cold shock CspA family protein